MVAEQEDEEDKVRWRVDAEVKLAREELLAQEAERLASHSHASASAQVLLMACPRITCSPCLHSDRQLLLLSVSTPMLAAA